MEIVSKSSKLLRSLKSGGCAPTDGIVVVVVVVDMPLLHRIDFQTVEKKRHIRWAAYQEPGFKQPESLKRQISTVLYST